MLIIKHNSHNFYVDHLHSTCFFISHIVVSSG